MKTAILLSISLFSLAFTPVKLKDQHYESKALSYQINVEKGMFNGQYRAWYKNGKIKAEGTFKNNQRFGEWSVWDSLGNLRMVRNYENDFSFSVVSAVGVNGQNITVPERTKIILKLNSQGFYEYPKLEEKDVLITTRLWRTIEPDETNAPFFKDNSFLNTFLQKISENHLTAYDPSSDEFKTALTAEEVKAKCNTVNLNVVAYKIKEDWFFNKSTQLSEARIIGICPVIKGSDGKLADLFWIYYPEVRGIIATSSKIPGSVESTEDLFFFRHFSSTIYKQSNVSDLEISAYKSGSAIKEEAERIEMELLDMDTESLIKLTE